MKRRDRERVLFLCTGNYYRSPFAEALFNSVAAKMGLPWEATSRGLALERGVNNVGPMASSAIRMLEEMGIRSAEALARMPASATLADFEDAARIVALKHGEHFPLMQERFPQWTEKVEFWNVEDDPHALPVIEHEVMGLVARLLGGGEREMAAPMEPTPAPVEEAPKLTAKVGRATKGRRGKGVTTVFDLPLSEAKLLELAAALKQRCGTGGTVKDGVIEIQGDQRERIVVELEKLGYRVKRAGG